MSSTTFDKNVSTKISILLKQLEEKFLPWILPLTQNGYLSKLSKTSDEMKELRATNILSKTFNIEPLESNIPTTFGRHKEVLYDRYKINSGENINVYHHNEWYTVVEGFFDDKPNGECVVKTYCHFIDEHSFSYGVFIDGVKEGKFDTIKI